MKNMIMIVFAALFALLFDSATGAFASPAAPTTELTVSAAISLKDVLATLVATYEETHPGTKIRLNLAASGALRAQIENGAPVDVFIPASADDLDALVKKKLIREGTRRILARNKMVLVTKAGISGKLTKPDDLKNPSWSPIAMGNPKTVPAGRYAMVILSHYKLNDTLKSRFVFGEHVRQVVDYVARGDAATGFVYATDVRGVKGLTVAWTAPAEAHQAIVYPAAVMQTSKQAVPAGEFVTYLASEKARKVWMDAGFE